jgi:predicted nucleotidyltransferase
MNREYAIATLRNHEPELKASGVVTASVFGSVARDDAGQDSDVDVAVRLANNFSEGGFDYFSRLDALEQRLSSILGCKVDVIEEPVRKTLLQLEIDRDRAIAF